ARSRRSRGASVDGGVLELLDELVEPAAAGVDDFHLAGAGLSGETAEAGGEARAVLSGGLELRLQGGSAEIWEWSRSDRERAAERRAARAFDGANQLLGFGRRARAR